MAYIHKKSSVFNIVHSIIKQMIVIRWSPHALVTFFNAIPAHSWNWSFAEVLPTCGFLAVLTSLICLLCWGGQLVYCFWQFFGYGWWAFCYLFFYWSWHHLLVPLFAETKKFLSFGVIDCARRDRDSLPALLSDAEFDEILQRNKTVSSTAISRAVQDASSGESLQIV